MACGNKVPVQLNFENLAGLLPHTVYPLGNEIQIADYYISTNASTWIY